MKQSYYAIKQIKGLPPNFIELAADEGTREFFREARLRRSAAKDAMATWLKTAGYSQTDANGLVDRGRMFVFSRNHLEKLFGGPVPGGKLLLDVGAGDGNITSQIAPLYQHIVATEFSKPMVRRLRERGYLGTSRVDALDDEALMGRRCYDMVMMLNVLDRADKPLTLLKQLKSLMKPVTGRLVLAVVLPWCPFVEDGSKQKRPSEVLPLRGGGLCLEGASFEQSVKLMYEKVLVPLGFELVSWTKLPYLCEGDGTKEYYSLNDAVFLLKVKDEEEESEDVKEPGILQPGMLEDLPSLGLADWLIRRTNML